MQLIALRATLRSNENNATRGAVAINSRSRCILEHGEGFDVAGVNQREWVRGTFDFLFVYWYAVNHVQRVAVGVERRVAADADGGTGARSAATRGDAYAGHFTLDKLFWVSYLPLHKLLGVNGCYCTSNVLTTLGAVAHNHCFR